MSDFFYNTINFNSEQLKSANAKAMFQADLILEIFKSNPDKLISPSQIEIIVNRKYSIYWPITSIRRSITDLSGDKYNKALTKTSVLITGKYNLPEHQWMLTLGNEDRLEKLRYEKGVSTAADFASMLINSTKKVLRQNSLFGE